MKSRKRFSVKKSLLVALLILMASFFVANHVLAAAVITKSPESDVIELIGQSKSAATHTADKVAGTIKERIYKVLVKSAALSLKNLSISLTQDLSRRSIEYLETGSFGQQPIWYADTWTSYVDKVEEAVLTDVLADISLSGPWAEYFDICEPNVELKLRIIRSVEKGANRDPFDRRTKNQRCSWSQVKDNWEGFTKDLKDRYYDNPEVASFLAIDQVVKGFEPQQSEIGTYIWTYDLLETKQKEQVKALEDERKEGEGSYKAKTNPTGTVVQNPPGTAETVTKSYIDKSLKAPAEEHAQALATIESIPEAIGSTILNSFVSKRFVDALFNRVAQGFVVRPDTYNSSQGIYDYSASAERKIAKIEEVRFSVSTREVDLLSEYTICDPSIERQVNHCVMTDDFADAVRSASYSNAMTVRQAVDEAFLDGGLPFVSPVDDRNLNPNCYETGYCYSNLIKLRKARIVPIGWELAAKKVGETNPNGDDRVNLNLLMDCFDGIDTSSKCTGYAGLVDPNWVLKYPKTRCDAVGYGPILITSGAEDRDEYCADLKSCVDENEDGSCNHYAYCAAEKNVWQFGAEQCPGYYDSCTAVENINNGKRANYLLNTVDYASCSADDVGCLGYSTWLADTDGGDRDFSLEFPDNYYQSGSSMVYLNEKIESETCLSDEEGCSRVIHTGKEYGTNLVPNGGFEYFEGNTDDGEADVIDGWNTGNQIVVGTGISATSVQLSLGGQLTGLRSIAIAPKKYVRYFIFSVQTRTDDSLTLTPMVSKFNFDNNTVSAPISVTKTSDSPDLDPLRDTYIYDSGETPSSAGKELWQIVRLAPGIGYLNFDIRANATAVVDNVLIAESEGPLTGGIVAPFYSDYGRVAYDYLKLAPDHYACYDADNSFNENISQAVVSGDTKWFTPIKTVDINSTNDDNSCGKFATLCSAEEVGCQEYIPTDGGRSVPGVTSYDDQCPAECAAYDAFSQSATSLALADYPLYFIPSTADQCPANQAGCEEFTNLDELDRGGESQEYFKSLRLCYKTEDPANDSSCGSYFTWIGDDTSGYQLQVYRFEMDGDNPKVTNMAQTALVCNSTNYDPVNFPECREFISESGQVFYQVLDNLVLCSNNCHPYRKTIQYEGEAGGVAASQKCIDRGGEMRNGECIFMVEPDLSQTCTAANAGCREYRGDGANDQETIFSDSFEASVYNWEGANVSLSTESMIKGGQSLKVMPGSSNQASLLLPLSLSVGEQFAVDFWAKADATNARVEIFFAHEVGNITSTEVNIDQATQGNIEFYHYTSDVIVPDETVVLMILRVSGETVYFDNINLKRLNDVHYLIQNSWSTPSSCDQTLAGQYLPQAQLGCQEYRTPKGVSEYLKSFRSLCRFDAIGCEAIIDTQNSTTPFSSAFNASPVDICTEAKGAGVLAVGASCQDDLVSSMCPDGSCTTVSGVSQTDYDNCSSLLEVVYVDPTTGQYQSTTDIESFVNNYSVADLDPALLRAHGLIDLAVQVGALRTTIQTGGGAAAAAAAAAAANGPDVYYLDESRVNDCRLKVVTQGYCEILGHSYQNGGCYKDRDQYTVPADNLLYAVYDEKKTCSDGALGCMMVGRPTYDENYNVATVSGDPQWDTNYYVLDPNNLDDLLCRGADSRCQEFQDDNDQKYYFKDPGERTCEYKTVANPDGSRIEGWYKAGTDIPCGKTDGNVVMSATKDYYGDGVNHLIHSNDPDYSSLINGKLLMSSASMAANTSTSSKSFAIDTRWRDAFATGTLSLGMTYKYDAALNLILRDQDGDTAQTQLQLTQSTDFTKTNIALSLFGTGFDRTKITSFTIDVLSNSIEVQDVVLRSSVGEFDVFPGWVGECKQKFSGCTAFIDPLDVSGGSSVGEAYYYINDENIDECAGVSQKEGCLLFQDTSIKDSNGNISIVASAALSYQASEAAGGGLVNAEAGLPNVDDLLNLLFDDATECNGLINPSCQDYLNQYCFVDAKNNNQQFMCALQAYTGNVIASAGQTAAYNDSGCADNEQFVACYTLKKSSLFNNTNRIISVDRDRQCAEWYDCKAGQYTFDPVQNREVFVCQDLGLCDSIGEGEETGKCSNFVDEGNTGSLLAQNEPMRTGYQSRDTSWNALDYSGYSVADKYPLQYYDSFDVLRNSTEKDYRLVHTYNPVAGGNRYDCETDDDCAGLDVCAGGLCIEPISGTNLLDPFGSPSSACRTYPRVDSPFPAQVNDTDAKRAVFENANTCVSYYNFIDAEGFQHTVTGNFSSDEDCACNYLKVTYGNRAIEKYYDVSNKVEIANIDGYCQDDPNKACGCTGGLVNTKTFCSSSDCGQRTNDGDTVLPDQWGTCMLKDEEQTNYKGWEGYCLEYDNSVLVNGSNSNKACLTWYPLDTMSGLQDLYNQYENAGYQNFVAGDDVGQLYCVAAAGQRGDANVDYVLTVPASESNGAFNDTFHFQTGYSASDEYIEFYKPKPNGFQDVYMDQIAGIAIECTDGQDGDWCGSVSWRTNNQDVFADNSAYTKASGALSGINNKFIIPYNIKNDKIWPGPEESSCFGNRCVARDKQLPNEYGVTDWRYWQVVWENIEGEEFDFGVPVTRGAGDNNYMFAGQGYNPSTGSCSNILTGGAGTADCNADGNLTISTAGYRNGASAQFSTVSCNQNDDGEYVCPTGKPGVCRQIEDGYYCASACTAATETTACNSQAGWGCAVDDPTDDNDEVDYCAIGVSYGGIAARTLAGACSAESGSNYFGLRVMFDREGKYQGIWFGLCDESTSYGYQEFKVHFLLNEYCAEVVRVAQVGDGGILENKAQTEYLYESKYGQVTRLRTGAPEYNLVFGSKYTPLGSAKAAGAPDDLLLVGDLSNADYTDEDPNGSPFSFMRQIDIKAGKPWGCPDGDCANLTTESRIIEVQDNNYSHLTAIFASVYAGWAFERGGDVANYYTEDRTYKIDVAGDRSTSTTIFPPVVAAAVLPASDQILSDPVTGQPVYQAIPKTISLNGRSSGDLVVFNGKETVITQFFAWANTSQMPLREVHLDWGDGETPVYSDGLFKNYKTRCQRLEREALGACYVVGGSATSQIKGFSCLADIDCGPGYVCNADQTEPSFGDSIEACDEQEFFKYENRFTCDGPDDAELTGGDPDNNNVCRDGQPRDSNCWNATEQACQFVPRVQVKDNWGWCNADPDTATDCTDFGNGFKGCYDPDDSRRENLCNTSANNPTVDPWTYFDGRVLLKP